MCPVHAKLLPPNELDAITGWQGCYGDQRIQMSNICEVFFKTGFPHCGFYSSLTVQPQVLSRAHSKPLFLCQSAGTQSLWLWKAGEPGEAFNSCPVTAPSLHGFPLYMDMFCFNSSFLLAALSVAQRGTHLLFIGTYLGKGRNPIFLSNP